jgi:hypothetical protein
MAVMAPPSEPTDRDPDFAEARSCGEVVKAFVASLETGRYSGDDSVSLMTFFTEMERAAVAGKTLAAHRVEASNIHHRTGHRSASEFIAAQTGDSVGESKDLLRLGDALCDQPGLEEAFRDGKLSRRRAAMVADAVKVNPHKEDELVKGAEHDTDAQLKERCQRAKAEGRSKEDAERHRRALHDKRFCHTYTDVDGAFRIDALFAPEHGAELKAALEAQADRQFDRARREGRFETSDAYRADALFALLTGRGILVPGVMKKSSPSKGGGTSTTPDIPTERRPDPNATISVVVGLETLRRGTVDDGGRCEIPGVGPVPVDYVRGLLGQALVELFITSATDVHSVYSPGRHIPRRIYSALMQRDPRCVVPGCDSRLGLENDHWVVDYAKGGLASMDNIARICHHHHQLRTHRGFQLLGGPGNWQWIPPVTPVVPRRPKGKRMLKTKAPPPPGTGPPLFDPAE